jgi:hypothetical protein
MTKLFGSNDDDINESPPARLLRPQRKGPAEEADTAQPRADAVRPAERPPVVDPPPATVTPNAAPTPAEPPGAPAAVAPNAAPPSAEPPGETLETLTGPPRRWSVRRPSWRTMLLVLAGLVVLVSVARGLVGLGGADDAFDATGGEGTGQGEPGAGPQGRPATASKPKTAPVRPVVVDGQLIKPAGTVLTLNPALAQPGATVGVNGIGFDALSTVDLSLSVEGVKGSTSLGSVKVDRDGGLSVDVTMPQQLSGGTAVVTAQQRGSDNVATAEAMGASGIGFVELGEGQQSGGPGDVISLSARGFSPGETINVYWGRASGRPATTLDADASGSVGEASVRVGTGAVGNATIVLVGASSGTTATAPFFVLGLYPTATATPFAVKAREVLNVSGSGFAPDERVLVYINASTGAPLMTAKADAQGNVGGASFEVPYGLKGSQSLVMVGELSRASVSSGFEILPYTPTSQPSTYGGSPGTTFSFYATGFGPEEVVEVYLGRDKGNSGELVSAFRVDEQGDASAAGSYMIQPGQQGKLTFTLVGRQSGGQTSATVSVTPASGSVELAPQPKYTLPPHLAVGGPSAGPAPRTRGQR